MVDWWLAMVAWCFMLLVVEYGSGVPGSTPGSVRALLWWLLYMLFFVFYTARLLNMCGLAKEDVLQWMPSFYRFFNSPMGVLEGGGSSFY
uniref:Uncharacterized protein n=1 Tax=Meloidogyne enterolobii TaxID=390850 RepID=A0A6V7VZW2_MELEN|nr:unnamed protein product [Meloidogyne enterolobii]